MPFCGVTPDTFEESSIRSWPFTVVNPGAVSVLVEKVGGSIGGNDPTGSAAASLPGASWNQLTTWSGRGLWLVGQTGPTLGAGGTTSSLTSKSDSSEHWLSNAEALYDLQRGRPNDLPLDRCGLSPPSVGRSPITASRSGNADADPVPGPDTKLLCGRGTPLATSSASIDARLSPRDRDRGDGFGTLCAPPRSSSGVIAVIIRLSARRTSRPDLTRFLSDCVACIADL
jgi:hypothetical protein